MRAQDVLKRPIVTEKNTQLSSMGTYVFEVDRSASKTDIKKAVESYFGVKVQSVNTLLNRGRAKRNKYVMGRTPHWKKAFVKLKSGEKIALFEGA